jgi:hypothetical protein
MNYVRIYNDIIENRKRVNFSGYGEFHHILPKSLGGSNDASNLVRLTAREHFICHLLLTKIHKGSENYFSMVMAFCMMYRVKSSNQERYISSRDYSELREHYRNAVSERQKEEGNSQFGSFWVTDKKSLKSFKVRVLPENCVLGRNRVLKNCKFCSSEHFEKSEFCTVKCSINFRAANKKGKTFWSKKVKTIEGKMFNSVSQAALELGVCQETIRQWLKNGKLVEVKNVEA